MESGVYTNAFYGLTYTVDSDMIYLTEAQLRRENGMRDEGESFDEELDRLLSGGRSYVLVEATNGDETKLFDIVCTNVIAGLSDDERKSITAADMIARVQDLSFKNITNYFENNGLRDAVIENTTIDFLGEERPAISVECPIYDTRIHQRIIFLEKDGYVAQLMVSCYGDDTSAGMLSRAQEPGFPAEALKLLLSTLSFNEADAAGEEKETEIWKCSVCGYIHEGPLPEDFRCPVCTQPASKFVRVE